MTRAKGKLKILYVVSIMPPYAGGAAIDYSSFVSGMGSDRFRERVESVTVLTEKGCARDYGSRVVIRDSLLNYDTAPSASKSLLSQLVNYITILRHILFGGYDVVHIHARYVYSGYIGRVVWLALVLSGASAVVDLRDRFYNGFGFGVSFIVCSDALKKYFSRISSARCIPVPLAFTELDDRNKGGKNFAYFGTIAANKGVFELIDGFDHYRRKKGGFAELHFYGSNTLGDKFLGAIAGKEGVRYMGVIEGGEVINKITEYGAVVLPSLSEGMPRVCLESIYCERAIVCHRNIKDIIPCIPYDFVLNDLAPGEFARVFERVGHLKGPVAYGYDFTAHHPESVCSLLLKHYEEIHASGRFGRGECEAHLIKRSN